MHGGASIAVRVGLIVLPVWFAALVLAPAPAAAQRKVEVEAFAGRPFGVARVTFPVDPRGPAAANDPRAFSIVERNGRAHYPAFTSGRILRALGELLGGDERDMTGSMSAFFLFTGVEPLEVTLYTPSPQRVVLTPQGDMRAHERLLARWWREYHALIRGQEKSGDYPPVVETYLSTMLGRRLELAPPLLTRIADDRPAEGASGALQQSLEALLGTENRRLAMMTDSILGRFEDSGPANLPVPRDLEWAPPVVPAAPGDVVIEPIAMHVPEECFYIRFGNFPNYFWMRRLLEDYGGDLSRMITLRATDAGLSRRAERQLALKESELAELLGETVIADVALLGRDTFTKEGAAVGILFQARSPLLVKDLAEQRAAAFARERENGATIGLVKVGGRDVSLVSTPDHAVRSFYAVDGEYHLVTSSRAIVERFFEAGAGKRSLGQSAEFRHARHVMPTSREDTIFVYLSSAFFRGLVSPQYQIELTRRLRAATDLELVQLARLAAQAERRPADSLDELASGGFLPRGFGRRADGSGPIVAGEQLSDSLRGGRGSFLPIADVPLESVTEEEAREYQSAAAFYARQWQQMDPLMIGIKRYEVEGAANRERIAVDGVVSPFRPEKYSFITSQLGPPSKVRIAPVPGDVISIQGIARGGPLLPQAGVHHVFLGVRDGYAGFLLPKGDLLSTLRVLQTTPGYLGTWPKLGLVDLLPFGLAGEPDPLGYSRLPFGIWRRQQDSYSVVSFHYDVLAGVTPQLRLEEAANYAQLRIRVADLTTTKTADLVHALSYARAREATIGNTRFLHTLSQQLGVPRKDALATAGRLLDARLVCPLQGEYHLAQHEDGLEYWVATKLADERYPGAAGVPADYKAPVLDWFRGVNADLTTEGDKLIVHAELDMQRKPNEPKIKLPLFNLNWFGAPPARKAEEPSRPSPEPAAPKPAPGQGREF
jgi:hypothetical protein